jgi:hypothetical protein
LLLLPLLLLPQIQSEVAEAWHVMEGATNERAARLTSSLNGHIQQLSAQLEGAVNEALQVSGSLQGLGCVCHRETGWFYPAV